MSDVTFFHNERVDGARRTGVTVDGQRAIERYTAGSEERDPSLRWYVDVVCYTQTPPATREAAEAWLADHAGAIHDALTEAADRLSAGVDADGAPWSFERSGPDGPVRVSVSAMRSEAGHSIGSKIRGLLDGDFRSLVIVAQPTGTEEKPWPIACSTPPY